MIASLNKAKTKPHGINHGVIFMNIKFYWHFLSISLIGVESNKYIKNATKLNPKI